MTKFTVRFTDRSPLDPHDFGQIQRSTITAPDEQTARDAFEVCNCEVIEVTEVKDWRDAQKRMDMIADITREIRFLSTSDEYIAWFEAAPEDGFFSAACDKLLSMKRPASFQDGRMDVTKYFNGITATASKTWAGRHLNNS